MVEPQVYTSDELLERGLLQTGMDLNWQKRQRRATNVEDFKAEFGTHPTVIAEIWVDLQTTTIDAARIDTTATKNCNIENFLWAFYLLMRYPVEKQMKKKTKLCENSTRKWIWYFVSRIQALKADKVKFPEPGEWRAHFIFSVDGVHTRFHEQKHATLSKDPDLFSWKLNGPGVSWELALHLREPRLVWIKRNAKTKTNDRANFVEAGGLRDQIPAGKKAVADRGYRGRGGDPKVAAPNSYDSEKLKTFKRRARMRQETFNRRLKRFHCLTDEFRHSLERHEACFEAVCVVCCYEMELISPLFEV